jgi:hypothetical protein
MDLVDERIPGVTFYLEEATISDTASAYHQNYVGKVVLSAQVSTEGYAAGMWEELVKRLECWRVYSSNDVKEELISMLQDDLKKHNEQHLAKVTDLSDKLARVRLDKDLISGELAKTKAVLAATAAPLARLAALEADLSQLLDGVVSSNHG